MTAWFIIAMCLLVGAAHVLSAIKSGCFYAASSGVKPPLLKRYMDNLHYVQTPFWYALFGAMFVGVTGMLWDEYVWWEALIRSYAITQGTSTAFGPLYQGFINVGGSKPFTDPDEKKVFEFAVPILNKSVWIPKFWTGKMRWILVPIGIAMIIAGITI